MEDRDLSPKKSYLQTFKSGVSRFIKEELKTNQKLNSMSSDRTIDGFINPTIYANADRSRLIAVCGIKSDEATYNKGLGKLLNTVSGDSLFVYKKQYRDLSVRVESEDNLRLNTLKLRGTSNGADVFKIEYSKSKSIESASISMDISKDFIESGYGTDLFNSVWKKTLLSCLMPDPSEEKKVVDTIAAKLKAFGAVIYKGDIGVDAISGYRDLQGRSEEEVIFPFLHQSELESLNKLTRQNDLGAARINAALFYGPTGNGKTLMAKALSNNSDIKFIYLPLSKVFSKYYSESPKRILTLSILS